MFKGQIFDSGRAFQHNSVLSKKKKCNEQFLPKFEVVHFWNKIFTHEFDHLQKDGEVVLQSTCSKTDTFGTGTKCPS